VSEPDVVISPTPRPLKKPEVTDSYIEYQKKLRPRAAEFYRKLQQAPQPIHPDITELVGWLRQHNVRIKAVMREEGTLYVLEGVVDPKTGLTERHVYAANPEQSVKVGRVREPDAGHEDA
jgi:hypothetical protein